jgi:hypothetical protein
MQTNRDDVRAMALKALAVIGFVAILIFGVWGLIQVGRMFPSIMSAISSAAVSLSSIFVPAERLEIALPSGNIESGEPFTISWTHEGKRKDGTYTLSFDCRDGLSMEAPGANGVYQRVFCNTPFNLTNETSSMKLIAISSQSRFLDVPLKLTFTRLDTGEVSAETATAITVVNDKVSGTATTTPPTQGGTGGGAGVRPGTPSRNTYVITQAGRASDPNGRADLSVTILDTGIVDSNNVYVKTGTISRQQKGAVRFVIENLGSKTVESWNFSAVLPTLPMHIFSSPMQPALGPGDKIEYTLAFDQVDGAATQNTITINADPSNMIWNEATENNNIAKAVVVITN